MKVDTGFERTLSDLTERVYLIGKSYNPDHLNLHFEDLINADSALFEALLSIGRDAWDVIQTNQSWETSYWFYEYFLLISRGSLKILSDNTQEFISKDVIIRLALLLSEISQLTNKTEYGGDIKSRNLEALANLLLAFSNLRRKVMTRAKVLNNKQVINYAKRTIKYVKKFEKGDEIKGS
jgi:hypothetical protein